MKNKYLSYLLQACFFIAIYIAIQIWQTRNLLPDNGEVRAPEFSLVGVDGKVYQSSDLAGKPTVIYFFAPWCKICHYSIPNLQALRESTPIEELNIIVIALDWQSKQEISQYVVEHGLTMPVLFGTAETMDDYKIEAFPTYYVLNQKQRITKVSMGYSTELGLRINTP